MERVDLSGTWQATAATEDLRRRLTADGPHPGDVDGWVDVVVPGHWRSSAALGQVDGPVLHRRRFTATPPEGDRRAWLVLDGVLASGDVWLDGAYVGDTEGYFFPHAFEVTSLLAERHDHVLNVEVACPTPGGGRRRRELTGSLLDPDLVGADWNPGGLWRRVGIEQTGPVRLRHLRIVCRDADEASATIALRAVLDTTVAGPAELRTTVTGPDGHELLELTAERPLAVGENRLEWSVSVDDPRRWWPWSLGDQPLHHVEVAVTMAGEVSDLGRRRLGLRQVDRHDGVLSINGQRLYLKGTNLGPTRRALADATPDEVVADVARARDAGLDLVRVHAHVARPELYDAADELGVLVWQDLPLQGGYGRGVRGQARRQARELVDLLGHHPSVAVWCAHADAAGDGRPRRGLRRPLGALLPTWDRLALDRPVVAALERSDPSRPVVARTGGHLRVGEPSADPHLGVGVPRTEARGLARLLRWWPRLGSFVAELGAQAVPDDADFLDPARWPDLDWDRARRQHGLRRDLLDQTTPAAGYASFERWQHATQAHQAELIRSYVETLRRLKYRPGGGFAQFCLADAHPAVGWSVLDHARRPKPGWEALVRACQPVIVVAEQPPRSVQVGQHLELGVHVVSDLHIAFSDMVTSAHLHWRESDGGTPHGADDPPVEQHRWRGHLARDACTYVGALATTVPPGATQLLLKLELRGPEGDLVAANSYVAAVTPPPDAAPVRT
jgi:beta-mannosidase